jgi:amino acid transporter
VGYIWKREGAVKLDQIDLDTGRRQLDWEAINAYRAEVATWPKWKRVIKKVW